MVSKLKVLRSLAEFDRMRAAGENLKRKNHNLYPLIIKVCDVGEEWCRSCLLFAEENNQERDMPTLRKKYNEQVKPLQRKKDSLIRLLEEQLTMEVKCTS